MDHELKIIMSGDTNHTVKVYINNTQISLIQDIKFSASSNELGHQVELKLPNLFALKKSQLGDDLIQSLQQTLDLLKEIPHIKVTLIDLDF